MISSTRLGQDEHAGHDAQHADEDDQPPTPRDVSQLRLLLGAGHGWTAVKSTGIAAVLQGLGSRFRCRHNLPNADEPASETSASGETALR